LAVSVALAAAPRRMMDAKSPNMPVLRREHLDVGQSRRLFCVEDYVVMRKPSEATMNLREKA